MEPAFERRGGVTWRWLPLSCACIGIATPAAAGGLKGLPDPGIDDYNLIVGPSFAVAPLTGEGDHVALGLDVTYSYSLMWASLGARFLPDSEWVSLPYGEVGVWLLANIGVGCTVVQGGSRSGELAPHLFVGVPVPFSTAKRNALRRTFIFEPYYRPTWLDGSTLHEVGLLLKVVAWSGKSRSDYDSPPPPPPPPRTAPPLVDPTPPPGEPEPAPPPAPEEPPHAPLAP
jgi:hypothetical protein